VLGSIQGDATRNIQGDFGQLDIEAYLGSGVFYRAYTTGRGNDGGNTGVVTRFDASRVTPTASEIRPVNTAVRYLIRTLP
jgi:hypothetical protein